MRIEFARNRFKNSSFPCLKEKVAGRKHPQGESACGEISPSFEARAAAHLVLQTSERGNRTGQRRRRIVNVTIAEFHIGANHGQQKLHQLSILERFPGRSLIAPQYLDELVIGDLSGIEII